MKMASFRSAAARAKRFKQPDIVEAPSYAEHINALGMVASLVGILMQVRTAIAVSPGLTCSLSTAQVCCGSACSSSVVYMTNAALTLTDRGQEADLQLTNVSAV